MKKTLILALLIIVILVWLDYRASSTPSEITEVTVVSVNDVPKGNGWRRIVVALPDDSERTIETLVPFFYRSGHTAFVAVYERMLFPNIYDFAPSPD